MKKLLALLLLFSTGCATQNALARLENYKTENVIPVQVFREFRAHIKEICGPPVPKEIVKAVANNPELLEFFSCSGRLVRANNGWGAGTVDYEYTQAPRYVVIACILLLAFHAPRGFEIDFLNMNYDLAVQFDVGHLSVSEWREASQTLWVWFREQRREDDLSRLRLGVEKAKIRDRNTVVAVSVLSAALLGAASVYAASVAARPVYVAPSPPTPVRCQMFYLGRYSGWTVRCQ